MAETRLVRTFPAVASSIAEMKYIVNFSGGACAFWAAHRTIERFGFKNVILLFADTLEEDDDLYTFLHQSSELLGVPITRVSIELGVWALFRREGLIGSDLYPICSTKLKREPLNEWMEQNYSMDRNQSQLWREDATVVMGFDWTEGHRVSHLQQEHPTWRISAPMTDEPIWDKCKIITESVKLGLPEQTLYKLGFPHNNCGGTCVRGGITHWVHVHKHRPKKFAQWESDELATIENFATRGIQPWSILKDRRGGETNLLTLQMLRHRIESGEKFSTMEWGGCGCGGATKEVA